MNACRNCEFKRPGEDGWLVCIAAPVAMSADRYEYCADKNHRGDCRDYRPNLNTRFKNWIQDLKLALDKPRQM